MISPRVVCYKKAERLASEGKDIIVFDPGSGLHLSFRENVWRFTWTSDNRLRRIPEDSLDKKYVFIYMHIKEN